METYDEDYIDKYFEKQNGSNVTFDTSEYNNSALIIPVYMYIVVSIVNSVIFVVGTVGNVLVIIVVLKVKEMRSHTNVFLLNLSVADILVLLVCQPAGLLEFFGKDRWFIGEIMCKVVPLLENGVLHVSILTLVAVTLERYIALCHPFSNRMSYTVSSTAKITLCIWMVGFTIALPFLFMTVHEDAIFYDGSPIKVCRTLINETWRYIYIIFIAIVFFVLPFFILIGIYAKIIQQLTSDTIKTISKNDRATINRLNSRKQVVKMLIIIIVLFFMSLFPIRVITLWLIFTPSKDVTQVGLECFLNIISWARILMYVNSACNPIIYNLTSSKFKMAFNKVMQRNGNSHFTDRFTSRYNGTANILRPVATHRRTYADRSDESDNRVEEAPYLMIKLLIISKKEQTRISSGHDTLEDHHEQLTELNENNPLIKNKIVSK